MALPNNPQTRKEMYLSNMAGQGTALPSEPHTREEEYLDFIAKNGGGGGGTGDGDMKKSVYDNDNAVLTAGGIKPFVNTAISGKVDKVQGKGLSSNDYDDSAKAIVDGVTTELDGKADQSDVDAILNGTNIDSFGDVETALAGKMPNYGIGTGLYVDSDTNQLRADAVTLAVKDSPKLITSGAVFSGLSPKYGTADQDETELDGQDKFPFYDNSASAKRHTTFGNIKAKLKEYFDSLYVAAVAGKGLSTNDYDDTEKAKVAGAFPRSEQAVLGAKQWFDPSTVFMGNDYLFVTNSGKNIKVKNDVTISYCNARFRIKTKPNTDYKLTTNIVVTSGVGMITVKSSDDSTDIVASSQYTTSGACTISFNSGNNSDVIIRLFSTAGTSATGEVSYDDLLLSLASDTDRTFAPYAMTNKELTEKHEIKDVTFTRGTGIDVRPATSVKIEDKLLSGYFALKNDTESAIASNTVIGTISGITVHHGANWVLPAVITDNMSNTAVMITHDMTSNTLIFKNQSSLPAGNTITFSLTEYMIKA